MENEKIYIRRFMKVFCEGMNHYWFDVEKFVNLTKYHGFDSKKLEIEIQCVEEDEKNQISAKTIQRVFGFARGEREGAGDKSVTIKTVKALGKVLCDGNEYGLLIKVNHENLEKIVWESMNGRPSSDIDYIFGLMNGVLYDLEVSSYYSYKPGTDENGYDFYDMSIQYIRKEIDKFFWGKKAKREKLYRLLEELEIFVKSYSRPGVPKRWQEANPKLRFYDCVFDFKEYSPHTYEQIKNGSLKTCDGQEISFCFYPSESECKERREYLEKLIENEHRKNGKVSYDRFYQNEVIVAFQRVFEMEFAME